jgi:hypothetical protein
VAAEPLLPPAEAYELVVRHRRKRVNSVQILKNLECFSGGKSQIDIPLCRMISLQIVRPALENDIMKLQADFIHGYRVGAAVFYVSLTDEHGQEQDVTATDRLEWNDHWRSQDAEFEKFLQSDNELKALSNMFFFVWDGNHRLLAWKDHIRKVHSKDLEWHYRVRSIVLQTKDAVADTLTAMHDINKATENSHVKSNLVHILHRMQKVGVLPLSEFKHILTAEELEQARLQAMSTAEKKPWYRIPRAKFLEYLHIVSIDLHSYH